jgi:uncharacterized membrane protein YeaQ/YmgE (transglycosylase-associated protein family)
MILSGWPLLGVVIGYPPALIMRSDADRGAALSTAAGILAALVAARLLVPVPRRRGWPGLFQPESDARSLLGAVVLVALVNLLRRGRIR